MAGPAERDPQAPPRPGLADPTRDIRLPPLPGTPSPELPQEWAGLRAEPASTPAPEPAAEPAGSSPDALVDQPTDELGSPPGTARDRTLTFDGTSAQRWAAGLPATPDPAWSSVPPGPPPVVAPRSRAAERSRRWPWVVLTLLPILVIVVTGVWLLVLMNRG
jgi:hypothetical protein